MYVHWLKNHLQFTRQIVLQFHYYSSFQQWELGIMLIYYKLIVQTEIILCFFFKIIKWILNTNGEPIIPNNLYNKIGILLQPSSLETYNNTQIAHFNNFAEEKYFLPRTASNFEKYLNIVFRTENHITYFLCTI